MAKSLYVLWAQAYSLHPARLPASKAAQAEGKELGMQGKYSLTDKVAYSQTMSLVPTLWAKIPKFTVAQEAVNIRVSTMYTTLRSPQNVVPPAIVAAKITLNKENRRKNGKEDRLRPWHTL